MRTSFKPTVMLIASRGVSFAATFFIPIVLVRIFDQATFGAYKQVFLVYTILYAIAQLGMAESLYYFIPLHAADSGKLVVNSMLMLGAAGLVCLGGLVAFKSSVTQWLENPGIAAWVLPLGIFLLLMLVTSALEIAMIARRQYAHASYLYALSDILRAMLLIFPVLIWKSLQALMMGAVVFAALRLLYTIGYLLREFPGKMRVDGPILRRQFGYTLPFELAIIVETLQTNYHQYAVSSHFGAIAFAVYAVGCLQLPFVDLVAGPACKVMMVRMSEEIAAEGSGLPGAARRVLAIWHDTTRKLALVFIPLFALLLVSAREIILLLFTDRYAAAIPIFMLWAAVVPLAVFQTDGLLRVYAQTRFILLINLIRLAAIAGLIPLFLSVFGLRGAVLITLFATAGGKLLAMLRANSLLETTTARMLPWGRLAAIAAASAAACLPAWIVKTQLHLHFLPLLALVAAVYSVSYVALVFGFDLLSEGERLAVTGWLRRPNAVLQ